MFTHTVSAKDAPLFLDWLKNRGGVAVWRSINLSNMGQSWSTPALTSEGLPMRKPNWQAANEPEHVITSANEVEVVVDREVKRFHVAVRMGAQGMMLKCTDASSARIRREVEKAGEGAYYVFDYTSQEAVIFAPASKQPLVKWAEEHP